MRDIGKVKIIATVLASIFVVVALAGSILSAQEYGSAPPRNLNEDAETSFEDTPAGQVASFEDGFGEWKTVGGSVSIDDKHSKTGKNCLHLEGGPNGSSIEVSIRSDFGPDEQLTFWAERWTSREPFEFRIEQFSDDVWTEIYNGDKHVKVGRAFLSQVKVPLGNAAVEKLRFTVKSPDGTGILIDDLKIAPAEPQTIKSVEAIPFTLPALVGAQTSALVKLRVEVSGTLNPILIKEINATIRGESSYDCIHEFQPYYGGSDSRFRSDTPFGSVQKPRRGEANVFSGQQQLHEGENFIWLGCQLKQSTDVDIDRFISATVDSITFSNGECHKLTAAASVQRMGVALRQAGDNGVHTYRIPGLATTNNGTMIGVYDVRHDSSRDLPGNIDVGMSRSTDGGQTWQPMQIIMDMGSDPRWRGDGIGDPSILVDRTTGTIWVSATWSHGNRSWNGSGPGLKPKDTGQWMLVKSDDDGKTWSDPINITQQVKNPRWSFLLQGPGKGITLSDGTLVFPAQYQDPPNAADKTANRLPHSTFIYSRDHGENWSIATAAWDDTTEAQVVELTDKELMINCRNNRAPTRAILTTTDLGKTWQRHPTHERELIEPRACMASLINVGRELGWRNIKSEFGNNFLLFSNPDSLNGRNHLTIKASRDSGSSWPREHHLLLDEQSSAGYSCMTMIDAETVGILYEGSQAQMTFQRIKIKDILSPTKNQKTKNPSLPSEYKAPKRPAKSLPTKLSLSRAFGDHMVIQANHPIRILGQAKPLATVTAKFMGKAGSAKANKDGDWLIELAPHNRYETSGQELVVSADSERVVVRDVLVGEVWLCAGQSNMEWELRKSTGGVDAIANADDPLLRLHNSPGGARLSSGIYSEKIMKRLWPESFSEGSWHVASPTSAASFSAVGYYFARQLRSQMNIPVGIVNVSVGGTPIESWVSTEQLRSNPELAGMLDGNWLENSVLDQWCRGRAISNLQHGLGGQFQIPGDEYGPNHSFKPGFMHEAGIRPFAPFSIRGVLWYQGESNGDNPARTKIYDACFPLLVDDFRDHFHNEDLPVVFVQLPAMGRANWPVFREYQRRSLDRLTNVGMAITIDTGHPTDVHPRDKRAVGNRLAKWALVETYGQEGISMGPLFKDHVTDGSTVVVAFEHVGEGLRTRDGQAPNQFEIAGEDEKFHKAKAKIVGTSIELTSVNVPRPIHVRYAWAPFPVPTPNLMNSEDLPASPFTSMKSFHP